MTKAEWTWLGIAILGILLFRQFLDSGVQPDMAQKPLPPIPVWKPNLMPGGVWEHPGYPWKVPKREHGYVISPHRYPRATGGELSAILRDGMKGFTKGPVQDNYWIASRPSTAMW